MLNESSETLQWRWNSRLGQRKRVGESISDSRVFVNVYSQVIFFFFFYRIFYTIAYDAYKLSNTWERK